MRWELLSEEETNEDKLVARAVAAVPNASGSVSCFDQIDLSWCSTPSQQPDSVLDARCLVQGVSVKGLGVVAVEEIPVGQLVLKETPLLKSDDMLSATEWPSIRLNELLHKIRGLCPQGDSKQASAAAAAELQSLGLPVLPTLCVLGCIL